MKPTLSHQQSIGLKQHLLFTAGSALVLMVMASLMRLALLAYNHDLASVTPTTELLRALGFGMRFDARVVAIAILPLLLAMVSQRALLARGFFCAWLTVFSSINIFLAVLELDFYREFHQRLNSLVFQYVKEDPKTVLSMIWNGYPVLRYLAAWALVSWLFYRLFRWIDVRTRSATPVRVVAHPAWRWAVLVLCVLTSAVAARGTLRQGSPLRWGDALYGSQYPFAKQLALNGTLTLASAAQQELDHTHRTIWPSTMSDEKAKQVTRDMLLLPQDRLVDAGTAGVRRIYTPPESARLPAVRNVVVILMESFSARFVGALGNEDGITPNFDRLAGEGLLFTRFFSNGTHTHQGMFATMGCFPNLPGYEYLMKQPVATYHFSGLPQLLKARHYDDYYIYNGDFGWDNQYGFFSNQGISRFIGRYDFVNPVFSDMTWGVSDQDMYTRAAEELAKRDRSKPFYAWLQTLSNHVPFALPDPLPVEKVTGHGALDEHLTAMRYADWALGRFFERVKKEPFYQDTLFVLVGDHGFGVQQQLTDIDLFRFNVPLLLIGPGVQEMFGARRDTVGTQVDIVPTIMGRLGGEVQHQCWGRDLLALPAGDPGIGVIKPSGSEPTVALVSGDRIVVKSKDNPSSLYRYSLGKDAHAELLDDKAGKAALEEKMSAFLQVATHTLVTNNAGAVANP